MDKVAEAHCATDDGPTRHLHDLPPEIRDMIYRLTLLHAAPINLSSASISSHQKLLEPCTKIFWAETTFKVTAGDINIFQAREALEVAGGENCQNLPRLVIHVPYYDYPDGTDKPSRASKGRRLKALCTTGVDLLYMLVSCGVDPEVLEIVRPTVDMDAGHDVEDVKDLLEGMKKHLDLLKM
jgi:hypothetical protein